MADRCQPGGDTHCLPDHIHRSARHNANVATASTCKHQRQQMAISPNGALISVSLGSTGTQSFPFNASSNTPIGSAYTPVTKPYGSAGAPSPWPSIRRAGSCISARLRLSRTPTPIRAHSRRLYDWRKLPVGTQLQLALCTRGNMPPRHTADAAGKYVYAASWQSGSAGAITGYSVATSALTQVGAQLPLGPNRMAWRRTVAAAMCWQ